MKTIEFTIVTLLCAHILGPTLVEGQFGDFGLHLFGDDVIEDKKSDNNDNDKYLLKTKAFGEEVKIGKLDNVGLPNVNGIVSSAKQQQQDIFKNTMNLLESASANAMGLNSIAASGQPTIQLQQLQGNVQNNGQNLASPIVPAAEQVQAQEQQQLIEGLSAAHNQQQQVMSNIEDLKKSAVSPAQRSSAEGMSASMDNVNSSLKQQEQGVKMKSQELTESLQSVNVVGLNSASISEDVSIVQPSVQLQQGSVVGGGPHPLPAASGPPSVVQAVSGEATQTPQGQSQQVNVTNMEGGEHHAAHGVSSNKQQQQQQQQSTNEELVMSKKSSSSSGQQSSSVESSAAGEVAASGGAKSSGGSAQQRQQQQQQQQQQQSNSEELMMSKKSSSSSGQQSSSADSSAAEVSGDGGIQSSAASRQQQQQFESSGSVDGLCSAQIVKNNFENQQLLGQKVASPVVPAAEQIQAQQQQGSLVEGLSAANGAISPNQQKEQEDIEKLKKSAISQAQQSSLERMSSDMDIVNSDLSSLKQQEQGATMKSQELTESLRSANVAGLSPQMGVRQEQQQSLTGGMSSVSSSNSQQSLSSQSSSSGGVPVTMWSQTSSSSEQVFFENPESVLPLEPIPVVGVPASLTEIKQSQESQKGHSTVFNNQQNRAHGASKRQKQQQQSSKQHEEELLMSKKSLSSSGQQNTSGESSSAEVQSSTVSAKQQQQQGIVGEPIAGSYSGPTVDPHGKHHAAREASRKMQGQQQQQEQQQQQISGVDGRVHNANKLQQRQWSKEEIEMLRRLWSSKNFAHSDSSTAGSLELQSGAAGFGVPPQFTSQQQQILQPVNGQIGVGQFAIPADYGSVALGGQSDESLMRYHQQQQQSNNEAFGMSQINSFAIPEQSSFLASEQGAIGTAWPYSWPDQYKVSPPMSYETDEVMIPSSDSSPLESHSFVPYWYNPPDVDVYVHRGDSNYETTYPIIFYPYFVPDVIAENQIEF